MDPAIQAKLLKVIEEKRFRRVGENRERFTDVRVIAATNADLMRNVREGLFRRDLFFRICVLPMRIPPLRSRPQDIPLLARKILGPLAVERGSPEVRLSESAEQALMRHPWLGNLRELRAVLERALLGGKREVIEAADLRFHTVHAESSSSPATAWLADGARSRMSSARTSCACARRSGATRGERRSVCRSRAARPIRSLPPWGSRRGNTEPVVSHRPRATDLGSRRVPCAGSGASMAAAQQRADYSECGLVQ